MEIAEQVRNALQERAGKELAEKKQRFFKTGPGEYGEGDLFLGIDVPGQRQVAKQYFQDISLEELAVLLAEPAHEYRKTALFMLVEKYKKSKKDADQREQLAKFFLEHLDGVDNWDLVDSSAHYVLGPWLYERGDRKLIDRTLDPLADSGDLWRERIAVMTTFHFVKQGAYEKTLQLAEKFLSHPHDLIHKAVGWMLREIGNRDLEVEERFLRKHYRRMPRIMLRYAIEKLPEQLRQSYLNGRI